VKATNPTYIERTITTISDIVMKTSKIVDLVAINIGNHTIKVYEVGYDSIHIYKFERQLANDIIKVSNQLNESNFDIEIAIPISFKPVTYNEWDARKVMSKTPEACSLLVKQFDDVLT